MYVHESRISLFPGGHAFLLFFAGINSISCSSFSLKQVASPPEKMISHQIRVKLNKLRATVIRKVKEEHQTWSELVYEFPVFCIICFTAMHYLARTLWGERCTNIVTLWTGMLLFVS
jgi:hypothetical protein